MIQSALLKRFLFLTISIIASFSTLLCASAPWTTPAQLTTAGNITSNVFSSATSAGFMAVWADAANNGHYSFSNDGVTWKTGSITSAAGNVASTSDIFVAGNSTGFMVTWMDGANNAWSSLSTNNGTTWSAPNSVNHTLTLDGNSDVYVSAGPTGFVATMIGTDRNAYINFSTGTAAWNAIPTQITNDGAVYNENWNSETTRGFVSVVVAGTTCMVTWITTPLTTSSAYFSSINPFSSTTVYSIMNVGFFESVPIGTVLNGYFMTVARANQNGGIDIFAAATTPANWGVFSLLTGPSDPNGAGGPWVAANQIGFMSTSIIGGSPMWTLSTNNGFNWTSSASILATPSTTIVGPVGVSANSKGFVATWLDSVDSNAYASFYLSPPTNNLFDILLEQKYGSLL